MPSPEQITEADFEAAISDVLLRAFPALGTADIQHQTSFRIQLGRNVFEIQGGAREWATGRSDLLITKNGRPLAILELKRPGISLADTDRQQGLSYAKLTDPWAPLVIVSNQHETHLYETFTGKAWEPQGCNEAALADLLAKSATLALSDLRNAVETLLGASDQCWITMIRSFTHQQIDRLTGDWDDLLMPFPKDLLLPRKATAVLRHFLENTDRVPFLIGAPLSGKSNVLREFVRATADSTKLTTLYLDIDSSGYGILQTVANLMTQSLGWNVDANQARTWLRRISQSEIQPSLVLLVDGGNPTLFKSELDELVSGFFGPNLRLVISTDIGMAKAVSTSSTGRQRTHLGGKAAFIEVSALDEDEFNLTSEVLHDLRLTFMNGSRHAADHRVPWLLRSMITAFSSQPQYADPNLAAAIPSVPGMQPLAFAEQRFGHDAVLKGQYLKIAEAMILNIEADDRSPELTLLLATNYACRFDTLKSLLGETEIQEFLTKGHLKHRIVGNERVVVAQLPTFVASCASQILAGRLATQTEGGASAVADRLVAVCGSLAFGEVIGALAICRYCSIKGELEEALIARLLQREPTRHSPAPGTKFSTLYHGTQINVEIIDDQRFVACFPNGERCEFTNDPDDVPARIHSEMTSWLILSHLAIQPFIAVNSFTDEVMGRVDLTILREVGSCKVVLKRPESDAPDQVAVHELTDNISIVCHKGIIEPITFSLYTAMTREREIATSLIAEAIERGSISLLCRINIGLLQIEQTADREKAEWAARVRKDEILPMLNNSFLAQCS